MRRRAQRVLDVIRLGVMAERVLRDPRAEVYLRREPDLSAWLRVDDCWRISPSTERLVHRLMEEGS